MSICLRRREFIAGLGGAAALWPLATHAQQQALPVVGYVSVATAPEWERAFRQGLGEAGYSEGRNVTVEYHILDGKFDRQDSHFHGHFWGVIRKPHSHPHGQGRFSGKAQGGRAWRQFSAWAGS